jgi:hypothetical protein
MVLCDKKNCLFPVRCTILEVYLLTKKILDSDYFVAKKHESSDWSDGEMIRGFPANLGFPDFTPHTLGGFFTAILGTFSFSP